MSGPFTHKCADAGCPYLGKVSPHNCGCHRKPADLMAESHAELLAVCRKYVAQIDAILLPDDDVTAGMRAAIAKAEGLS